MAFILPFELLQVKFTESIQEFLESRFERIDIYTFQSLVFDTAGQDTILLVAHKKHIEEGLFIYDVECPNRSDSNKRDTFVSRQLSRKNMVKESGLKWSSLILSDDDLNFLNNLSSKFLTINECLTSRPGIVTAANEFFIVNEEVVEKFQLNQFAKPVVQKGLYVNGSAVFSARDHQELISSDKPSFFLDFNAYEPDSDELVEAYLAEGLESKLEQRFKCKQRDFWFKVPVVEPGEGFFFKRSNEYPKLLKNSSSVLTTDTAYNVYPLKGYKINSIIYSFYNPLTLCFAELIGRHYGGGVLELIPSEFRKLPLPYIKIDGNTFNKFVRAFNNKGSILDILDNSGRELLVKSPNISNDEVDRLIHIYRTLVNRRFSKSRKGARYT